MSSIGKTVKVSGPLIIAEGMADAKMYESSAFPNLVL